MIVTVRNVAPRLDERQVNSLEISPMNERAKAGESPRHRAYRA